MAPAAALIALGLGLCLVAPLGGCVSAAIGAGATAGVTIAQERSVEEAIGDAAIKVALTHKLIQADFRDLFRAVGVDVIEGRVMLSGIVDNQRLKDQAGELTWQVGDVDEEGREGGQGSREPNRMSPFALKKKNKHNE